MTEHERQMLEHTNKLATELYDAFMKDSPTGEAPLIRRISAAVVLVERSNWVARGVIYLFLTAGAIAGAWATLKSGLNR